MNKFSLNKAGMFLVLAILALAPLTARAAGKAMWKETGETGLNKSARAVTPEKFRVFGLNSATLRAVFEDARSAAKDTVLEVPMPDGSLSRFRLAETDLLAPHLAAEHSTWRFFEGYGIDDPAMTARFDWNELGFHAYINTPKGVVYIDPYQHGDTSNYLVFYKHQFGPERNGFYCRTEQQFDKYLESEYVQNNRAPEFSRGANVRTFRIAVATTGEWARNAANYNGTQTPAQIRTSALAVITTTINRLNGIYIRELASAFQIANPNINNNAANIIFDNPATDPYDNSDDTAQLTINQTTVTSRVGAANFDIGHLYGTGGGGVAASPSLCDDTSKAQGYSARGTNTGDPFVVDYVAHELGHQFGAAHTYNNADASGACTTRSASSAFEVASGSTLMSYVGICSDRNLQQYVDTGFSSFHIRSLTEIDTNLTTGDPATTGCGVTSTSNAIPTVSAGAAYTIPALTPFTLTATGADADAGDVANLLYSWEEYDLGGATGALGTPAGGYDVDTLAARPILRAYSPVASNARTFPSLNFILNPAGNDPAGSNQPPLTYTGTHPTNAPGAVCEPSVTCVIGERLPTRSRTMNFRVSLRDRRGGMVDAGTTVTVNAAAGPFRLTAQDSLSPEASWAAGSSQLVTWDVAGTTAAPISAANVNIRLSTDGGLTFPVILAANTPNDGSETITVPNNTPATATARIRIEAVGNIFFDINNVNFAITPATAAAVSVSGQVFGENGHGLAGAIVTMSDEEGRIRRARTNPFGYYSFDGVMAGQTYIFGASAKRHRFAPRTVTVNDALDALNFSPQQAGK